MSWTVVEFVDTNTVEAVPTAWIQNDECFWPTMTRNRIILEIKKNSQPNTCWPRYKVRIFKDGTYEEYLIARNKARKAEDTSDLNSDIDMKRKITKKVFDDSPHSDTSSNLSEDLDRMSVLPVPPRLSLKKTSLRNNDLQQDIRPVSEEGDGNDISQSVTLTTISNEILPGNCETTTKKNTCCCKEVLTKLESHNSQMEKKLSSVKANLLQIREDIQTLLSRSTATNNDIETENLNKTFSLPFYNEKGLQELEEFLCVKENFEIAVAFMKKVGGKDEYELIKRCMSEIMTDSLAMTYAYDGTKEKKCFKTLKLNSVIQNALHSHFKDADKKIHETSMRKYLRRAKERSKGKMRYLNN